MQDSITIRGAFLRETATKTKDCRKQVSDNRVNHRKRETAHTVGELEHLVHDTRFVVHDAHVLEYGLHHLGVFRRRFSRRSHDAFHNVPTDAGCAW